MQLPTNLLTFLLTSSSFLTLITAAPTAASPAPVADDITYHTSTSSDNDPNDPAIAFFSSLPPPSPKKRWSSPNPSSPSVTGLATITKRGGGNQDYCRGGGFFNATSDGSPWIDDCRVIIRNIAPKGGKWHYMTGSQRTLVSHGSCALGIESTDGVPPALQTLVGDLDIAEWIQKSIDLFGTRGGKVGSYGDTQCPSTHFEGDEYGMRWGLYRAKGY
ncbi:putative necrosis-inducing factor-domain-containing protein [Copromyces sp. CBS 386.78]|nr:putative necrosis-inducing factor-domain-containing protein [Copromyces sp. CBS 386.78]